jgi:ankyrin repeat protein
MSALHQAARAGDLRELERLHDAGTSVDLHDEEGHTPLMTACLSPDAGLDTLEFLIARGADVNALTRPEGCPVPESDTASERCPDNLEQASVLSVAVASASAEKLRLLLAHGADPAFTSARGWTPLSEAAFAGRRGVIDLLLAAGAPPYRESGQPDSLARWLSRTGCFRKVGLLLEIGADPAPLAWTPLHHAIALGSLEEVASLLDQGADPEAAEYWKRTAFLLSVHSGDLEKVKLLLSRGVNREARGDCGRSPLHYPIDHDNHRMLRGLLELGFDRDTEDESGHTPVMAAVEESAVACFEVLMEAGASWKKGKFDMPLIAEASHPAIIRRLLDLGENPGDLETEVLRDWIGLGTRHEMPVTLAEFQRDRTRRFGSANPERMDLPFWRAMVRNGWWAGQAAGHFGDKTRDQEIPIWCHDRFGMSLTPLPDGRWIQIAGEHEDHYDADFCIYNDVILHDGKGGFEILGYPEEVFPPTDFHSATLVGEWIYLIGNLGYPHTREAFGYETPVFRFHTATGRIEPVATSGGSPGWIHKHRAKFENGTIRVFQGKVLTVNEDGESNITGLRGSFSLDLTTGIWTKR